MTTVLLTGVYAAVKLLAYSAWCYAGLRVARPGGAAASAALRFGGVRWCLGLAFGVAVFLFVGSIDASAAARTYFLVYSPVRVVEWGIMAFLIRDRAHAAPPLPLAFWCVGGLVVSFATDLLSPDGVQGRFCVGRCLC